MDSTNSADLDTSNENGAQFSGDLNIQSGTVSLTDPVNSGATNVIFDTANNVGGSVTWQAGSTLNVTGSGVMHIVRVTDNGGTVSVGAGATMNIGSFASVRLGGSMDALADTTTGAGVNVVNSGTFDIINSDPFTQNSGAPSGTGAKHIGNLTGTGSTTLEDATVLTANRVVQSGVTLNGSGTLIVSKGATNNSAAKVSTIGALTVGSGVLDVGNSDLVLTATPLATVKAYVNSAATADGAFTGNSGITSSVAAAIFADGSQMHKTGLGYGVASSVGISSVDTTGVNPTDVIVKYTLIGDTNMDGKVNALDFNAIATTFGQSGTSWTTGDVTYDGSTDTSDFTAMAQNFAAALPAPPAAPRAGIAGSRAGLARLDWTGGPASAPQAPPGIIEHQRHPRSGRATGARSAFF